MFRTLNQFPFQVEARQSSQALENCRDDAMRRPALNLIYGLLLRGM